MVRGGMGRPEPFRRDGSEAVPGRGWVSAPGMDDWRRRGIGEALVTIFWGTGGEGGVRGGDAEAPASAPSGGTGGLEGDWTHLPAGDASSREPRDPAAILAVLAATPVEFGRLLDAASADALTQPAHDGGAAVVEIVAHLRDWEAVVGEWVDRMLADDEPPLLTVPDDSLWAIEHDYAAEDPHQALAGFRDRRNALLDRMGEPESARWARTGTLDGEGERSVREVLDVLCERDALHLQRAREALS